MLVSLALLSTTLLCVSHHASVPFFCGMERNLHKVLMDLRLLELSLAEATWFTNHFQNYQKC